MTESNDSVKFDKFDQAISLFFTILIGNYVVFLSINFVSFLQIGEKIQNFEKNS